MNRRGGSLNTWTRQVNRGPDRLYVTTNISEVKKFITTSGLTRGLPESVRRGTACILFEKMDKDEAKSDIETYFK